ncbi:hypothetical protein BDV95DRAFT_665908 [Massariosphaeria phaeospora]|uniref:Uncharacterized protein n=1 Tax=Massariosphaeria phaeospora TaxID=100035 RepID=A0A7C8IBE2_9PLEO|nr:hypothetical protein BDV95DRAFT_665908 [Massariosphaeria phaeospora]
MADQNGGESSLVLRQAKDRLAAIEQTKAQQLEEIVAQLIAAQTASEGTIAAKDVQLAVKSTELTARDAAIVALKDEIAALKDEIVTKNAQLSAKGAEIAPTNARLAAYTRYVEGEDIRRRQFQACIQDEARFRQSPVPRIKGEDHNMEGGEEESHSHSSLYGNDNTVNDESRKIDMYEGEDEGPSHSLQYEDTATVGSEDDNRSLDWSDTEQPDVDKREEEGTSRSARYGEDMSDEELNQPRKRPLTGSTTSVTKRRKRHQENNTSGQYEDMEEGHEEDGEESEEWEDEEEGEDGEDEGECHSTLTPLNDLYEFTTFPDQNWTDLAMLSAGATRAGAPAWKCETPHAWGLYYNAADRANCRGCSNSNKKSSKAALYLPFDKNSATGGKGPQGYVIFHDTRFIWNRVVNGTTMRYDNQRASRQLEILLSDGVPLDIAIRHARTPFRVKDLKEFRARVDHINGEDEDEEEE